MHYIIFDVETDGLLDDLTKIHTLCLYDSKEDAYFRYELSEIEIIRGLEHLARADVIIGHNIINFDIPAIVKLYPDFEYKDCLDTLVLSRLIYSNIFDIDQKLVQQKKLDSKLMGRHSLKAWGYRLGVLKGDYGETTDWQEWSQEMSDYCMQDVVVTQSLYLKLMSKEYSEEAIQLEHDVAHIIQKQMENGVEFDEKKAEKLYCKLLARQQELQESLKQSFGSWIEKDGEPRVSKVNNSKRGYVKGCKYQRIKYVEFNPNSRTHIYKRLIAKYGWKPTVFTPAGQPKVDESVLATLKYPEAILMSEYLMLAKRLGMLGEGNNAWLKLVKEGRIYGYVNTLGTQTFRMSASKPNLQQIPAVRSPYGVECRELFKVKDGFSMVGADASGLELRVLAHYLAAYDGGAYADIILNGDIHSANQKSAGLPTRDAAKTFVYAMIYGASPALLGKNLGASEKDAYKVGLKAKKQFLKNLPAFEKLLNKVQKAAERGYLNVLDGHRVYIRSKHSALNFLLQSTGAIVMKRALVILNAKLKKYSENDVRLVLTVHDEASLEAKPEIAKEVGKLVVQSIIEAGEYYNFRCPLDGESQVGTNWSQIH